MIYIPAVSGRSLVAAQTEYVKVADKPLGLGGKVEKISVAEFEKRHNCRFREGVSVEDGYHIPPFKPTMYSKIDSDDLKNEIDQLLSQKCSDLVICDMGPKFGVGVFTEKPIFRNKVVAIFSGTIRDFNNENVDDNDEGLRFGKSDFYISTSNFRGIATYMQHLPERPKFKNARLHVDYLDLFVKEKIELGDFLLNSNSIYTTKFLNDDYSDVAFENVDPNFTVYKNLPVIVLIAREHIAAGSQLGFSYSNPYWRSRNIVPDFFTLEGKLFPRPKYRITFGTIRFPTFLYMGDYKPLRNLIKPKNIIGKPIRKITINYKGETYVLSRVTLLYHLLVAKACHIFVFRPEDFATKKA